MRVIYGTEVNTTVEAGVSPESVMATLGQLYAELSNAVFNVAQEGGEEVMRITLQSGTKAGSGLAVAAG